MQCRPPCPASLPQTGIFSVATVHSGGSLAAPLHSSLYCDTRGAALPAGRHSVRDRRAAHTSGARMTKRVLSPGYRDLLNFYKRCALFIAALVSSNLNEHPPVSVRSHHAHIFIYLVVKTSTKAFISSTLQLYVPPASFDLSSGHAHRKPPIASDICLSV